MQRPIIILSIDGLGARYLGPYGNTWLATPAFDRLAQHSVTFDQVFAKHPGADAPQGWGWDAKRLGMEHLTQTVQLVTDSDPVQHWGSTFLHQSTRTDSSVYGSGSQNDISTTRLGYFFAHAIFEMERIETSDVLLLHTDGLFHEWDAPLEFREALRGDGDPETASELAFLAGNILDSDEIWRRQQAYAAQVQLLDQCLDLWLDALDELRDQGLNPLIIVTSPRGYPLGEHGWFGDHPTCLFDEALHVPLFIADDATWDSPRRVASLLYADDWQSFVYLDIEGSESKSIDGLGRIELFHHPLDNRDVCAIRTPEWKMIDQGLHRLLFSRPDDRWEQNDVASRCPQVIERLSDAASQHRRDR